jgi:hypothetical protein
VALLDPSSAVGAVEWAERAEAAGFAAAIVTRAAPPAADGDKAKAGGLPQLSYPLTFGGQWGTLLEDNEWRADLSTKALVLVRKSEARVKLDRDGNLLRSSANGNDNAEAAGGASEAAAPSMLCVDVEPSHATKLANLARPPPRPP